MNKHLAWRPAKEGLNEDASEIITELQIAYDKVEGVMRHHPESGEMPRCPGYDEYDNDLNEALENLGCAVAGILEDNTENVEAQ